MFSKRRSSKNRITTFILLVIIPFVVCSGLFFMMKSKNLTQFQVLEKTKGFWMDLQDRVGGAKIPAEYIPIYMEAAEAYDIPWTLLAAHHRVETRFSKMNPLVSPAGAEGHMQFMPCTFVGWEYPGCNGLGEGNIPKEDLTDPAVIAKYGGYGVDANGDGKADPYDIEDAIFSTANYISSHGAATGEIEQAIFEYNRSEKYVKDVLFYFDKYEDIKSDYEIKLAKK